MVEQYSQLDHTGALALIASRQQQTQVQDFRPYSSSVGLVSTSCQKEFTVSSEAATTVVYAMETDVA